MQNLMNKMNQKAKQRQTHRQIKDHSYGVGEGKGVEQLHKKEKKAHGQQCGDCRRDGCLRGINGNGKNVIKKMSH